MESAGAEQARRADENREWALKVERERDKARNAMAQAQGELDLKTLDFERMREQRDQLLKQLSAERALADRLGNALEKVPWTFVGREEQASEEWNAIVSWKEARGELKEAKGTLI